MSVATRLSILAALLVATSGCAGLPGSTLPGVLGGLVSTGGANPTVQGTVSAPQTGLRVGLLAQPQAGGAHVELASAAAANGSYAIVLNQPGQDLLQQPDENESYVFLLTPYVDTNGNGRYDEGTDRLIPDASGSSFRWFAAAGPSYQAGWNVYDAADGSYSQSFSTAYNL